MLCVNDFASRIPRTEAPQVRLAVVPALLCAATSSTAAPRALHRLPAPHALCTSLSSQDVFPGHVLPRCSRPPRLLVTPPSPLRQGGCGHCTAGRRSCCSLLATQQASNRLGPAPRPRPYRTPTSWPRRQQAAPTFLTSSPSPELLLPAGEPPQGPKLLLCVTMNSLIGFGLRAVILHPAGGPPLAAAGAGQLLAVSSTCRPAVAPPGLLQLAIASRSQPPAGHSRPEMATAT